MSTTLRVSCGPDGAFTLPFPDRCVYCGGPHEVGVPWTPTFVGYWQGKEVHYATEQRVPYCAAHAAASRRNSRVLSVAAWATALPVFLWLFSSVIHVAPGVYGGRSLDFVLSLFAALGTGVLAEYGAGRVLVRVRPSARDQLDLLGLRARFTPDGRHLDVTFTNDVVAAAFTRNLEAREEETWRSGSTS